MNLHHASDLLLTFLGSGPRNEGILKDLIETITFLNDTGSLLSILRETAFHIST